MLDVYYRHNKRPIGHLHELIINLKDRVHVRDSKTTMAYVAWIDTFEGKKVCGIQIMTDLRELAAVSFWRLTMPPSLMIIS